VPWFVGVIIVGAVCVPVNCAADQWNEYQNVRLHICFRYPESYKVVSDFSSLNEQEDYEASAEISDWTWRESRLIGFIQMMQEIGGLKFNLKAYANKDAMNLRMAAQRVVAPPAGLKREFWERKVDSLWINDMSVFCIDGYWIRRGDRLRLSRSYLLVRKDIIYSLSFHNPQLSWGAVDLIGNSEEEIAEIVASFKCTICSGYGAD
jgi:hypothetical protein